MLKKIFQDTPGGRRAKVVTKETWLNSLEKDFRKLGVLEWRRVAEEMERGEINYMRL